MEMQKSMHSLMNPLTPMFRRVPPQEHLTTLCVAAVVDLHRPAPFHARSPCPSLGPCGAARAALATTLGLCSLRLLTRLVGQAESIPQAPHRYLMEVQAVAVAGFQDFDREDVPGNFLEKHFGGFGLLLHFGGAPFI